MEEPIEQKLTQAPPDAPAPASSSRDERTWAMLCHLVSLSAYLIGIPLLIAVLLFDLIAVIVATVKSSEGVRYRYPLCIRFIR